MSVTIFGAGFGSELCQKHGFVVSKSILPQYPFGHGLIIQLHPWEQPSLKREGWSLGPLIYYSTYCPHLSTLASSQCVPLMWLTLVTTKRPQKLPCNMGAHITFSFLPRGTDEASWKRIKVVLNYTAKFSFWLIMCFLFPPTQNEATSCCLCFQRCRTL